MRETWVQSLGWEDPLEKGKATHPSILSWRIPGTVQSMSQRVGHDFHFHFWTPYSIHYPIYTCVCQAEYIMRNAGLEETQAGIKIAGISITSDMQMTPPLWQKVKRN